MVEERRTCQQGKAAFVSMSIYWKLVNREMTNQCATKLDL